MDSVTANYVEKIRQLCQDRNIPISKLEKDLGFGNGYLNSKKVATIKTDRLFKILDYIGISPLEFYNYIYGKSREYQFMEMESVNSDELKLVKAYREATEKEKQSILFILKDYIDGETK